MIDTVIFDFDGTLVDFINTDIFALRMLALNIDEDIDEDEFIETSVSEIMKFHSLVEKDKADPQQMHEYRLRGALEKFGIEYSEEHLNNYSSCIINNCRPYEGVENLLKSLQGNYKTGLLTNAYNVSEQMDRIRKSGLVKYFDEIVISGEIGIYKPDTEVFKHILQKMKSNPENTLFVGDSIQHDIEGAKKAGMITALIADNIHEYCNSPSDYLISRNNIDSRKIIKDIIKKEQEQ